VNARPTRIRLLPAAAVALLLLFGLKAAGLGEDLSAFLGAGPARAEDPEAEHTTEAQDQPSADEHAAEPAADHADEVPKPENGPTASEADVLESLAARREQLDKRARELDMREKVLAAAEKRIEERIAELKTIEGRIEAMFGQRDEKAEKQLADLVKMYEAMKPASAAAIFDTLEQSVLIDVIRRMKPAKASPILAAMKPDRAREVTVELARIDQLPQTADAPEEAAPDPEAPLPLPPGG
jgi:flagellar motility protein MotE (MotC chaperone)